MKIRLNFIYFLCLLRIVQGVYASEDFGWSLLTPAKTVPSHRESVQQQLKDIARRAAGGTPSPTLLDQPDDFDIGWSLLPRSTPSTPSPGPSISPPPVEMPPSPRIVWGETQTIPATAQPQKTPRRRLRSAVNTLRTARLLRRQSRSIAMSDTDRDAILSLAKTIQEQIRNKPRYQTSRAYTSYRRFAPPTPIQETIFPQIEGLTRAQRHWRTARSVQKAAKQKQRASAAWKNHILRMQKAR